MKYGELILQLWGWRKRRAKLFSSYRGGGGGGRTDSLVAGVEVEEGELIR